jgi:TetR/AcrR family transcriptional regulator, copper-responsive repressor
MGSGRPRGFSVDDAVDGAMGLFWRNGYRGTTTREIEAAAGIAPSSLYRAFGSKEGVLAAAVERYLGLIRTALVDPLAEAPDGLDAVDRFLAGLGEWLRADGVRGCLVSRLMAEGLASDPVLGPPMGLYRADIRAAIAAALRRAAAAGEIPAGTVAARTQVIVAAVLGMNLAAQSGWPLGAHRDLTEGVRAEVAAWRTAAPL